MTLSNEKQQRFGVDCLTFLPPPLKIGLVEVGVGCVCAGVGGKGEGHFSRRESKEPVDGREETTPLAALPYTAIVFLVWFTTSHAGYLFRLFVIRGKGRGTRIQRFWGGEREGEHRKEKDRQHEGVVIALGEF